MTDVHELLREYGARFDQVEPITVDDLPSATGRSRLHGRPTRLLAAAAAILLVLGGVAVAIELRTAGDEDQVATALRTPGLAARDDRGLPRVELPIDEHRGWIQRIDAGLIRWWRFINLTGGPLADLSTFAGVGGDISGAPAFYFRSPAGALRWQDGSWAQVPTVPDDLTYGGARQVAVAPVFVPFGDYGIDIGAGDDVQRILITDVPLEMAFDSVSTFGSTIVARGSTVMWIGILEEIEGR